MKIKKLLIFSAVILLLLLVIAVALLWNTTGQLIRPERRPLQEYHYDWIDKPSLHGIRVHSHRCDHGIAPCLIVVPDTAAGPGKRGKILRDQLERRGVTLLPYGETQGIMVLLHGRSGRKEDLLPIAERFAAVGFKCVIPDLPAHGNSPMDHLQFSPDSPEQSLVENVLIDARNYLADQTSPAGIWGISMGGAYAVNAVYKAPKAWKAMVIVSSFDSLQGVMEDRLSALPTFTQYPANTALISMASYRGNLAIEKVQPAHWANRIKIPALVIHGDKDGVISMERGHHLFNALHSQDKTWLRIQGASHGNILTYDKMLYADISEWLLRHVR